MLVMILIISILVITIIFILAWHFSSIVIYPKVEEYNFIYDREVKKGKIQTEKFKNLEKQEVYLDSEYGYTIHGFFFPNNNSKKVIILCHGITTSLYCSVKYMDMFLKRGFNVFIYDHRNHGLSGGKDTSYGYFEKFDLKKCTDWLYHKLGKDLVVGLHGESMGASIVLENITIDDRISFCINDCGFSDAQDLFKYRLEKDYSITILPLLKLSSKISKLRTGWSFEDVSPMSNLGKCEIPILFIHGEDDDYVPVFMCKQMYAAKKGYKEIYIAPNAGHAQAYWNNKDEYEKRVDRFLKAISII